MNQQKAGSFLINEAVYFENYQQLMEVNRKQVFAEIISDEEKQRVVQQLLNGAACQEDLIRYKKRMRVNPESDELYPHFYIPPYHGGKKLRLIQGYLPQTHLLYANHYELEILRLLSLFAPDHEAVMSMVSRTESRLKNTCFGVSCTVGDCSTTGISVLRFLAAARPDDTEWIYRLMEPLGERFLSFGTGQAATQNGVPLSYLLMALTDIHNEKAEDLIRQKKDYLLNLLKRGWITGKLSNGKISEGDTYNVLGKYILRNALGILPEYKEIARHKIYINEADGRCYCDI